MSCVFMFAGQGSQYYGMGRTMMVQEPVFAATVREGNDHLKDAIGRDSVDPCLIDQCILVPASDAPLDDILLSHSGLVIVQVALAKTLQHHGVKADAVWGSSVGEYAAAVIAGCYSFADAVYLAVRQALRVRQHCEPGAMLAALTDRKTLDKCLPARHLAAINFDHHHILSGTVDEVNNWQTSLEQQAITTQKLPVRYGFHSAAIDLAREAVLATQHERRLQHPSCAYYSSLPVLQSPCTDGPSSPEHFWDAVRQPIHFQARYQSLIKDHTHFIDLSPTATLATFCKYNALAGQGQNSNCYPILNPWAPQYNGIETIKQQLTRQGTA